VDPTIDEVIAWLRKEADEIDEDMGEGTEAASMQRHAASMLEGFRPLLRSSTMTPLQTRRMGRILDNR